MPDDVVIESGKRFAADLRRIRSERGITLDDVHDETMIPVSLIESFEQAALFDHPMFNKVYLRSFVRTYAQVVGISPEEVAAALEQAFEGVYRGALTAAFLSEEASVTGPAEAADSENIQPADDSEASVTEAAAPPRRSAMEESEPEDTAVSSTEPEEDVAERREEPEEGTVPLDAGASAAATSPPGRAVEGSTGRAAESSRSSPDRRGDSGVPWIYAVIGVVVVGLFIWLLISLFGGSERTRDEMAADTASTIMAAADTASAGGLAPEPIVIGDSLRLQVIAARGPVRELRVRRDTLIRRPYWVEEGQSRTFTAANRIILSPPIEATRERPLDMIDLQLEGYDYPTNRRDEEGRIVITRDVAQAYLDSLARHR